MVRASPLKSNHAPMCSEWRVGWQAVSWCLLVSYALTKYRFQDKYFTLASWFFARRHGGNGFRRLRRGVVGPVVVGPAFR